MHKNTNTTVHANGVCSVLTAGNFKPILFSTPMVQAILKGEKTMTRRIIKIQKDEKIEFDNSEYRKCFLIVGKGYIKPLKCKYKVGDILWVRETWGLDYFGSGNFWHLKHGIELKQKDIVYKADDENRDTRFLMDKGWKPSIFMPKAVCRIFLKVTKIRIERLHDISNNDIVSEGAAAFGCVTKKLNWQLLWEKINGVESWNENPYVFVYEFERSDASFACR